MPSIDCLIGWLYSWVPFFRLQIILEKCAVSHFLWSFQVADVCPCCFGLLQEQFCSLAFLTRIQEHVLKSGHTWRSFWCSLTTPSGADFRARMFDEFWDANAERISGRLAVKDAWKAIVTPVLTGFFNTKWTGHEGLEINLTLENSDIDGRELEVLKKKFPHAFQVWAEWTDSLIHLLIDWLSGKLHFLLPLLQEKRGSDGKVKRTVTRNALDKILSGMRAYDFNLLFPFPPLPLTKPSELVQITLVPCSVFIAGRYLKHSRSVSQTPWFIEEERKGDASVEELICTKLQAAFQVIRHRKTAKSPINFKIIIHHLIIKQKIGKSYIRQVRLWFKINLARQWTSS